MSVSQVAIFAAVTPLSFASYIALRILVHQIQYRGESGYLAPFDTHSQIDSEYYLTYEFMYNLIQNHVITLTTIQFGNA